MAELVANCPRCGAQDITFDVKAGNYLRDEYDWKQYFEAFSVCRRCHRGTTFEVSLRQPMAPGDRESFKKLGPSSVKGALNDSFRVEAYIAIKDMDGTDPPEHVPPQIAVAFTEGATCLVTQCWNASGAMFRLAVDLATIDKLPPAGTLNGPNHDQRNKLAFRLKWLFDNGKLPDDLRDLSGCIREDGNDGAHHGTLTKEEAQDLEDFTVTLLERVYTEPERVKLAQARRVERRKPKP